MALPPSDTGAVQDTTAWAFPATADTAVGAPGVVIGVTLLEAADAGLVPTRFVAATVNAYAVPLVKPVSVALVAGAATVVLAPAGFEVMV
jgi:hypothetical protein